VRFGAKVGRELGGHSMPAGNQADVIDAQVLQRRWAGVLHALIVCVVVSASFSDMPSVKRPMAADSLKH
jgi:hypothetical protein